MWIICALLDPDPADQNQCRSGSTTLFFYIFGHVALKKPYSKRHRYKKTRYQKNLLGIKTFSILLILIWLILSLPHLK
jgi:hypothetical protein